MIKSLFLLLFVFFTHIAWSTSMQDAYHQAEAFAKSKAQQTQQQVNQPALATSLPNATENPPQTQYNDSDLQSEAAGFRDDSGAKNSIQGSFNSRPVYKFSENDPTLNRSKTAVGNSSDVVNGQVNSNVSCSPLPQCTPQYEYKVCDESNHLVEQSCIRRRQIQIIQPPTITKDVTVSVGVMMHHIATVVVDLKTGRLLSSSDVSASDIRVEPVLSTELNCNSIKGVSIVAQGFWNSPRLRGTYQTKKVYPVVKRIPDCSSNFQTEIEISQQHHDDYAQPFERGAYFTFRFTIQPPSTYQASWDGACENFEHQVTEGICKKVGEGICTEERETRYINELPITQDCWAEQYHYQCAPAFTHNNCEPLRNQGCEQTNSQCLTYIGNLCAVHQQSYRCPKNNCDSSTVSVLCTNGQVFCIDGNCQTSEATSNSQEDLNRAVSTLSALAEASKNFANDQIIFRGEHKGCRSDGFSFSNCCKEEGWGQDINLTGCDDEEKELIVQKEKGLCTYVGKKCLSEALGSCIKKKKVYCCFKSKLGRIIQEQGRRQLGLNFGDGEHPDCRGFTADELQRMNFGAMDLSEFYADVESRIKPVDNDQISGRIQQHANEFYQQGTAHEQ